MTSHIRVMVLLAAFFLVLALSACTPGRGGEPGESDSDGTRKVVRIAFVGPMSGAQGAEGRSMARAAETAAQEANASEDVRQAGYLFVVETHDVGEQLDDTLAIAEELLERDDLAAIVGYPSSDAALFVAPELASSRMPMVTPAVGSRIAERGEGWVFRIGPRADRLGEAAARLAREALEATSAVVIDDGDATDGARTELFSRRFETLGGDIVGSWSIPPAELDIIDLATETTSRGPDVVFFSGDKEMAAQVSRALHDRLPECKILLADVCCDDEYASLVGSAGMGDVSFGLFPNVDEQPRGRDFALYFEERNGVLPRLLDPYVYDATWAVVRAVLAEGHSRPDVARGLWGLEFDGVTGKITFSEAGEVPARPLSAYILTAEGWVLLDEYEAD